MILVPALAAACAGPQAVKKPPPPPTGPSVSEESGLVSWYGGPHHGRRTASGEIYDMHAMTAAHKTLPFGTWVEVENLHNRLTTKVRVNDRGPFVKGRILDVSRSAAVALGMMGSGVIRGRLRVVSNPTAAPAPAFVVQLGAFTAEASARDLRRRLIEAGFEVEVITATPGEDVVYGVRSGRFATRTEADVHATRLERAGYGGFVIAE